MVRLTIILGLVIILLSLFSCKDAELITKPYIDNTSALKLNGYYYQIDEPYDYTTNQFEEIKKQGIDSLVSIYFLYQNGVFIYAGSVLSRKLDVYLQKEILNPNYHSFITKRSGDKTEWGVVNIQGKKIEMEGWQPSSGEGLQTTIKQGIILNDTTFVMKAFINHYENDKKSVINEIYHFRAFSPKPDSTNQFIK